jgi:hypothetical protein
MPTNIQLNSIEAVNSRSISVRRKNHRRFTGDGKARLVI